MKKKMVDRSQLAEMMGLTYSQVSEWARNYKGFPPGVRVKQRLVYDVHAVLDWLNSKVQRNKFEVCRDRMLDRLTPNH